MLIKVGNQLQYLPVISKIKLNKKRLAQIETLGEDGEPINVISKQVNQIFIAPRGPSQDDKKQMLNSIEEFGL